MIRLAVPFSDDTLPPDFNYNLENEPSQCIGLLPKPGCGSEPEQAGDRGGGLQYAVFALIIAGLAIIFTVVFRRVIRGDRAKAERAKAERTAVESTKAQRAR
jgi:hypothetical protein